MFTIFGKPYRHCDGLYRRGFLTAGALGMGALTLADLLRAEAAAGIKSSTKAIINIHLDGGPPQLDTIDPKPDAPVEYRGDMGHIATKLEGVHFNECLKQTAAIANMITARLSMWMPSGITSGGDSPPEPGVGCARPAPIATQL